LIKLRNINKYYKLPNSKLHVLKDINIDIENGEYVSIMGASGSGKSTLLNILGILDDYDSGEYYIDDVLIKNLSQSKSAYYRNHFVGFVFQSFNLLPFKNAIENVALPLYYRNIARKERNKIAEELLDKVGLNDRGTHFPNELSGGQKQRVAIARALITKPKLILADEPTGALDTNTTSEIMNLLTDMNNQGMTVLIVTHENEVAEKTKRIIRLKDGTIEKTNPWTTLSKT
jgi:putative ABC transport system ATP-binding protein